MTIKILALAILVTCPLAHSSEDYRKPPPEPPPPIEMAQNQDQAQGQNQAQNQTQQQTQDMHQKAEGGLGEGGSVAIETIGSGDNISTMTTRSGDSSVVVEAGDEIVSNESNFFALSTTFPNGHGCFVGAQGGKSDGADGGGWLGFHYLSWECFSSYLSELKKSVAVKARLDCSSRRFRNAISFEFPRRDRQSHCVEFMVAQYTAQLEFEASLGGGSDNAGKTEAPDLLIAQADTERRAEIDRDVEKQESRLADQDRELESLRRQLVREDEIHERDLGRQRIRLDDYLEDRATKRSEARKIYREDDDDR